MVPCQTALPSVEPRSAAPGYPGRNALMSSSTSETVSVLKFVLASRLNILIVFLPIALVLRFLGANDVIVFVTSALAVIPLAGMIGAATDETAKYVGAGLGGFLSATF